MRRAVRSTLRVLGYGLLALGLALAILPLALQLSPVRRLLRDQLVQAVQPSLQGKLHVGDVRWPWPNYVELSDVRIEDRHGGRVLGASKLFARLRLRSLFDGALELDRGNHSLDGGLRRRYVDALEAHLSGEDALHQGPHAQFAGDGQGLVQQGRGLLSVARFVPLEQGIGVVAAGPGQLGPVAPSAEGQGFLEVDRRLVKVAHGVGQEG